MLDGLGMLVNQGVISIRHWTGVDADAAVMRRKVEELFGLDLRPDVTPPASASARRLLGSICGSLPPVCSMSPRRRS